ncbi:hypothetical protein K474DRAFT_1671729 [Panus rudis PR-1116 ss-1]|nr:hypothetical protein K474DRAFT_1671729 [Panus rudis PR-1116 ss-1]
MGFRAPQILREGIQYVEIGSLGRGSHNVIRSRFFLQGIRLQQFTALLNSNMSFGTTAQSMSFNASVTLGLEGQAYSLAFLNISGTRSCISCNLRDIRLGIPAVVGLRRRIPDWEAQIPLTHGGLATFNFALRTIAVWQRSKWIVGLIIVLTLGHWSLILHGPITRTSRRPTGECIIEHVQINFLAANFIYSMAYDLVILLLTAYKITRFTNGRYRGVIRVLFQDGLVFFLSTFLANLVAAIALIIHMSPTLNVFFNQPAVTCSSIAATRAIRGLTLYVSRDPDSFDHVSLTMPTESLQFRVPQRPSDLSRMHVNPRRLRPSSPEDPFPMVIDEETGISESIDLHQKKRRWVTFSRAHLGMTATPLAKYREWKPLRGGSTNHYHQSSEAF